MTLYILNYNNYYNRIVKKYNTTQEYLDNVEVIYTLNDTNFNPSDNVNTTHDFGWSLATDNYEGNGDYLIVVDDNNYIVSRWFILDSVRDRGGQWTLSLRRDVIADHYEAVIEAPCFIEKGILSVEDNFIFNKENMTFNKIKTAEYPLIDATQSPWLVGYINRSLDKDKPISYTVGDIFDFTADTLENFEVFTNYNENSKTLPRTYEKINYLISFYYDTGSPDAPGNYGTFVFAKNFYEISYNYPSNLYPKSSFYFYTPGINDYSPLLADLREYYNSPDRMNPFTNANLTDINSYNNKIVKVGNTNIGYRYYRMRIAYRNIKDRIEDLPDGGKTQELYNTVDAAFRKCPGYSGQIVSYPYRGGIGGRLDFTEHYLNFTDITDSLKEYGTIISGTRNKLNDAPYDMICFPVNKIEIGDTIFNEAEINLSLAQQIYKDLGGGTDTSNIFDIQLLPYCPLSNKTDLLTLGLAGVDFKEHIDYDYIKEGENIVSIMFYPKSSSFTDIIPIKFTNPTDSIEFKINNECDMYRLCSPNYNGLFEFNITENRGLNYVEVNATYKPYNPYIHLNPNWGGLYGQDFNDARGLILGGDFSIAALSSAWEQYQLQNKNYQAIFDREVQSMKLQHSIAREQDYWNAVSGTLQGTISGVMAGSMPGGGAYGAIAGGIIGGITSLGGGITDIYHNEQLRNNALDYSKDMFNYNLGNIQAIPMSLSKTSAFDINNKIFPFIEYYTATDEEKEMMRNKIKYNGMTVMRIDKISNYILNDESYIKGKIIRIEDFNEDYHILNTIGYEVNLGFFIKKEDTN